MKRLLPTSAAALGSVAAIALAGLPSAVAGPSRATVSGLDSSWLRTSIQGDRFEIAGGKLAQQQGSSPAVKALGARLVKDHTKSLKDAVRTARRLDIEVPKKPSPPMEWELGVVGSQSGATFDQLYTTLEIADHKQDIDETKNELAAGLNRDVMALARADLPVLRRHLKLARAAAGG